MRRRDAIDSTSATIHRDRRRTVLVSTALSLVVHAALLATALGVMVARVTPERLIRVSIAAGGGSDRTAGGSGEGTPPGRVASGAPEAPPAPPVEIAQLAPQPRTKSSRPRARRRTRDHSVADTQSRLDETGPGTASANPGGGQGDANGLASGDGAGVGGGTGGGNGTGAGGGDQRAHCLYCPEPQYPLVARRRGWEGIVHVGLSVLADGTVENASLRQSSGHSVLDRAAVEVARQSRFTPPVSLGLSAPLYGRIEYRFQLSNTQ